MCEEKAVLSSRVRLARNFADIPFVHKQDDIQAEECVRRVASAILEGSDGGAYTLYRMDGLESARRQELEDEHKAA